MKLRKKILKAATLLLVTLIILNPETMALGLLIDAVGFDLLLLLLEVQLIAVMGYFYNFWAKPVLMPFYRFFHKLDPYFFIPTKHVIVKFPSILFHAIPGLMIIFVALL